MVASARIVERFKQARLPPGSSWFEVNSGKEHKWVATVNVASGKWVFTVLAIPLAESGGVQFDQYKIQVSTPNSEDFEWPKVYRKQDEARQELEAWAQTVKKMGTARFLGWKRI